ncbi:hypothetical protein Daus18300_006784 [Diaporthe australafricana]|uniref:Uncharacterized protein n=1 Tax=Diaporthe australafricana TaxID=127596 RepID=A0ABR3WS80_9PEZI
MSQSSQPFWPSPNCRDEEHREPASTPVTNCTCGERTPEQQKQLLTPQSSSSYYRQCRCDVDRSGSTDDGEDDHRELGLPAQPGGSRPGGQQRRYLFYPGVNTRQQQAAAPAPYQSNGSRRRRNQTELLMHHAIAWLGYGEVVPNVSVVTGEPLVPGPVPTHGTRRTGGNQGGDVDDLAVSMSRALTIEVNRRAAEEEKASKCRYR